MRFLIDDRIFAKFHRLHAGVMIAKGVDNSRAAESVQNKLREIEKEIKGKYSGETLSQDPKIDMWRKAYSSFGAKPKENRSSVESLYRFVLQGASLRHINALVDVYNLVSLKNTLPVGGEDIDKIQGDIILTFARSHEAPVMLLGDKEARPPHEGEVIYKDDISAVCRRWNWREADRTKLTEATRNCILVIEGLPPITKEEVENAVKELEHPVRKLCGGNVSHAILDQNRPGIGI